MKLEKEIENLKGLRSALTKVLDQNNCLEYYKPNMYLLQYVENEIKKLDSNIYTLTAMLCDKEYLLEKEGE